MTGQPIDYRGMRKAFEDAGYTDSGILEALGIRDIVSIRGDDVELLLMKTGQPTPLNTLIRLFGIGVPCAHDDFRRAVAPMDPGQWAEAGLVTMHDKDVSACLKILPYHNLLVAFDPPGVLLTPRARDYVMGIGSSTLTLANLTVRKQSRRTLDLGTGCGFHAFLASSHSTRVYGTDINLRAVNIASFNGLLNGLENIDFLHGNLFEPVSDRRFDLIVSNPPFVISPERRYTYRDGGMEGDGITQKIIHEAPNLLTEGGYCQILCNWAEKQGQDWKDRLQAWFEGSGCDAWVIRTEARDPATYAATWIRHTEKGDHAGFGRRMDDWLGYYERQGIGAIGAGLITLRRRAAGKGWFRADDGPDKTMGPCGEHIVRGFELRDFLERHQDDARLLEARLRACPDMCMERRSVPTDEGWQDASLSIHLNRGLGYSGNIDPFVADLITGCDGGSTLGELLARISRSLQEDPSAVAPAMCSVARGLIERGFLLPG